MLCNSFVLLIAIGLSSFVASLEIDRLLANKLPSVNRFYKTKKRESKAQEHTCIGPCQFDMPFNGEWALPSTCARRATTYPCAILVTIDLDLRQLKIQFFVDPDPDVDETFQSILIQMLHFRFIPPSKWHEFEYLCSVGNECEWKYAQKMVPTLFDANYMKLNDGLQPLLYNLSSTANVTQCYAQDALTNCAGGMCATSAFDKNGNPLLTRYCSTFNQTAIGIDIDRRRVTPAPSEHDLDVFGFACNIDQCNSPTNDAALKRVIESSTDWIVQTGGESRSIRFNTSLVALLLLVSCYY